MIKMLQIFKNDMKFINSGESQLNYLWSKMGKPSDLTKTINITKNSYVAPSEPCTTTERSNDIEGMITVKKTIYCDIYGEYEGRERKLHMGGLVSYFNPDTGELVATYQPLTILTFVEVLWRNRINRNLEDIPKEEFPKDATDYEKLVTIIDFIGEFIKDLNGWTIIQIDKRRDGKLNHEYEIKKTESSAVDV